MDSIDRGQLNSSAAEIYDAFFVPALFQQWADHVADAAHLQPGQRVLDVACGTGVLARAVADRVRSSGLVAGLDMNDGMLAVAAQKAPHIDWRQGQAELLPFDGGAFDAVVSQFGLMFFEDRQAAIREMWRVLRPGGRLAVAVWGQLEHSPGYAAMAALLDQLFGGAVANSIRAPFKLGDTRMLHSLFRAAGISDVNIASAAGEARFQSLDEWVRTEIKGWVLADTITEDQFGRLLQEARRALSRFETAGGTVQFSVSALIVSAVKP